MISSYDKTLNPHSLLLLITICTYGIMIIYPINGLYTVHFAPVQNGKWGWYDTVCQALAPQKNEAECIKNSYSDYICNFFYVESNSFCFSFLIIK